MYNSSIKGQGQTIPYTQYKEIPGKVFYNDMSKEYYRDEFSSCDVIFSEIAWAYGYKVFNGRANNEPEAYSIYLDNINKLIHEINIPAFIVVGKSAAGHFKDYEVYPIKINTSGTNMSGCRLYVYNYDFKRIHCDSTDVLTDKLSKLFNKCLDFSCGYGEHLLKFKDFVGCDIDRGCLTYLTNACEREA